jgi:hypothetical protein
MRCSNTMQRRALFLCLAIGPLAIGCASIFHGAPELQIAGPKDIRVETMDGKKIIAKEGGIGVTAFPDPASTDSVRILYGPHSAAVGLTKTPSGWLFLDILTLGVGFPIDDASHRWFNYAPIYVDIDSNANAVSMSATTRNWFGVNASPSRPQLLVTAGVGYSYLWGGSTANYILPQFPSPFLSFQGGLGIDVNKKIEAFYLVRNDLDYPIGNVGYYDGTASIKSSDICLRYFIAKNLYLQGSYGWATVSTFSRDYYYYDYPYGYSYGYPPAPFNTPTFNEAGAAIGWSGDMSYIALQYFGGLKSFDLPYLTNVRYHTVYLNFGFNVRL